MKRFLPVIVIPVIMVISPSDDYCSEPVPGPSDLTVTTLKLGRSKALTLNLAATMDRTKVSDRKVLGSRHQCYHLKQKHHSTTTTTIYREEVSINLRLNCLPGVALIVQWDGTLLPDLNSTQKVDRIPIIVTSLVACCT